MIWSISHDSSGISIFSISFAPNELLSKDDFKDWMKQYCTFKGYKIYSRAITILAAETITYDPIKIYKSK